VWSHHVHGASMQYLALNYLLRFLEWKSAKKQQGVWW
jgi:hypothetical protein